jgi:hypothetical protein
MRDENWSFEWLGQLKKDVDHLTKMIYATQYEMEFFPLKEARKEYCRMDGIRIFRPE